MRSDLKLQSISLTSENTARSVVLSPQHHLGRYHVKNKALASLATIALALMVNVAFGDDDRHDNDRDDNKNLPYPNVTDTSHATDRAADILEGFFSAKSLHHAAAMVSFFAPAPDPVLYIDAGLGFAWPSQASLLAVWSSPAFANGPPDALSYPLRILGD